MQLDVRTDRIVSRSANAFSTEAGGEVAIMSIAKGRYYALNDIASEIWRKIEHPIAVSELTGALIAHYEGDPERIESDLRGILEQWLDQGLIELSALPGA